jgi:hypothetical protein
LGLSELVARTASRQAHALVVAAPGGWRIRAGAERAVFARGWSLAFAPADADVLIVCGEPGPLLAEAVEMIWHQLPGPRVRVEVREYDDVARRLVDAHAALLDTEQHRHDAQHRPAGPDLLRALPENPSQNHRDHEGMHHGAHEESVYGMSGDKDHSEHVGMDGHAHEGHAAGTDHGVPAHEGHEGMDHSAHGGMDHSAHGGMDHSAHGDMDMAPGGIPLAEGGEDRDGLRMDVLTVRLGPVLPHWPAGLVLRCLLQGDVITAADAELDPALHLEAPPHTRVRSLDNAVSVLALAGWDDAAAQARRIRDAVLEHGWSAPANVGLRRLRRRVRRSWLLRWSLRDVAELSVGEVHQRGLPSDAVGDTYDRLIRMLDRAGADVVQDRPRAYSVEALAQAIIGLDLATARLALASLDAEELRTARSAHEAPHG